MMTKYTIGLIVLLAVIYLTGCKHTNAVTEEDVFIVKGDTVLVLNKDILESQIKTDTVRTEDYSKEVITAGTVQPIPTQYAFIAPPFSGRIVKSFIHLGQKVKPGTPLFEISCPDFTTTQKDFFQARSEKELAQKDLVRKENLLKYGATSQREYEEAENVYLVAEKEYENALAALNVYQIDINKMFLGQPLVVYAPIAGEVIENNIVTGQYITENSEPQAIIADLSKVWITAQVKEKDIRFIHKGDDMDIHIVALPESAIRGKVFHIQEAVDEETRAIKVLSVCDNDLGKLKIGMYTTVHFLDKPTQFVVIPETALLQGEKNSYVYVKKAPDTFIKTPVELETTQNGKAVISHGLATSDVIITEGGYYLPQNAN